MTRIVLDRVSTDRADAADPGRSLAVLQALLANGHAVTLAGGAGAVAPADASDMLVLCDRDGEADRDAEAAEGGFEVRYRAVAGLEPDAVVELVVRERREPDAPAPPYPARSWTPWFPVIDYDRCTNCMQCLSFCLFGVYDVDEEKRIEVHEPEKCKTNCPACSRVCPEVAILFPKYKNGPINGDAVQAEDVEREKMKTDISSLLGGDIYSMLRERHKRAESRFSKERDESRALKERQRCLKKLQEALDIPEELLNELPSAAEIQARFEERARKPG
jgi:NAD-dependent dihydropyrimidine dehydrogenase PreA subunit